MRVEDGKVVGKNWDCECEENGAGDGAEGADDEAETSDRRDITVADCGQRN